MASGLFFGGVASGFQRQEQITNAANYQEGLLKLEQQRQQNEQQNKQRAEFMQLRSDAVAHLDETAKQLKIAHPDWGPMQLASNSAIVSLKDMIGGFDKNLGLPNTIDSIVAALAERPSTATTAHALALATGEFGKTQAQTEEAKARTGYLNRGGLPADNTSITNPSNPDLDVDTQLGGKPFVSSGNKQVDSIVKGIKNGDQPPVFTGLYKLGGPVRAGLENNGINVSKLQLQWKQAEKQVQSLNGPQMTRYVGLNSSVINTIDEVNGLAKQLHLSGIPMLNQAELTKLIQTQGNTPQGQLAARYIVTVGTLKEEFANLANGGYAPTDPAWTLANRQVNENYGVDELGASLQEIQKLMKIRINAIPGMKELGPGSSNQYSGGGKQETPPPPAGFNVLGR